MRVGQWMMSVWFPIRHLINVPQGRPMQKIKMHQIHGDLLVGFRTGLPIEDGKWWWKEDYDRVCSIGFCAGILVVCDIYIYIKN